MGPRAAPVDPWESRGPPLMSRAQKCMERIERIRSAAGRAHERRTSNPDAANSGGADRGLLCTTVSDSNASHSGPERRALERPQTASQTRPIAQRPPDRVYSGAAERPKVAPKSHSRVSDNTEKKHRNTPKYAEKNSAGRLKPPRASGTHPPTSTSSRTARTAETSSLRPEPCESAENVWEDCPALARDVVREGKPASPSGGAGNPLTSVDAVIALLRTADAEEERAQDADSIPRASTSCPRRTVWEKGRPHTNAAHESGAKDGRRSGVAAFLPDPRKGQQQAPQISALPDSVNVLKAQKDEFLRAHVAAGLMHQAHESMLIVEEDVQARLDQALQAAEERFVPLHTELDAFVDNCRTEILRLEKLLDEALAQTTRLEDEYDHCRQALQDEANVKREAHRRVLQQRMEIEMNGALNLQ